MQQIYTGLLQLTKFNDRGSRFKPARKRASSRRVWYLEELRLIVREIIQIVIPKEKIKQNTNSNNYNHSEDRSLRD